MLQILVRGLKTPSCTVLTLISCAWYNYVCACVLVWRPEEGALSLSTLEAGSLTEVEHAGSQPAPMILLRITTFLLHLNSTYPFCDSVVTSCHLLDNFP